MKRLSAQQQSLVTAAVSYAKSLPGSPAEQFLETRGLPPARVVKVRFGYVDQPEPGHEQYRGMLAIPYLRRSQKDDWTVAAIRFRCIAPGCEHSDHGKYNTVAGDKPRLYNTVVISESQDRIAITEGEIDAITATLAGVPAVGVPGANLWKPHYKHAFEGFEKVFVLADGDPAGLELMKKIAGVLPNAVPSALPPGEDVNSFVRANGPQALLERIGW